jgi:hypothetical protein
MEQDKGKTFDHLEIIRHAARELAMTRQETDAWIEETVTEIEKAIEEKAEKA